MKCKNCAEGRRFASGAIECLLYGFIIRADHEGKRKGCEEAGERAEDRTRNDEGGAEIQDDGWDAVDRLQGVL